MLRWMNPELNLVPNTSSDYRKNTRLRLISDLRIVKLTLEKAGEVDRVSARPLEWRARLWVRGHSPWNASCLIFTLSSSAALNVFSILRLTSLQYSVDAPSTLFSWRVFTLRKMRGKIWRGKWCTRGDGGNSLPFKYMVNKGPSRSVVFTLLVGKQIDTGGFWGGCKTALWSWARLKSYSSVTPRCWE